MSSIEITPEINESVPKYGIIKKKSKIFTKTAAERLTRLHINGIIEVCIFNKGSEEHG